MKKILLFICLSSFITALSFSQVAINTTGAVANSSAILDISSTSKGVLIPRISLVSATDNITIPNPAPGLMLFNTNANLGKGTGFYFNGGTAASPSWTAVRSLVFPFSDGTNSATSVFSIENYSSIISSSAIKANAQQGIAVEAISGSGIGVAAKSFTGNALEVSGKVKIWGNGQVPAAGKVLTSDANGNATWEGARAFMAVGMKAGGSNQLSSGVETKVAFGLVRYDLGNDYNDANKSPHSTFTVPVTGIYHFDIHIKWLNSSTSGVKTIRLIRKRNGGYATLASESTDDLTAYMSQAISLDFDLAVNDEIYVTAYQDSGDPQFISPEYEKTWFNARLVMKF